MAHLRQTLTHSLKLTVTMSSKNNQYELVGDLRPVLKYTEAKISERQYQVNLLLGEAITERAIAKTMGVSRETIVRDVHELKQQANKWLTEEAKTGFIFQCKLALDKLLRIELDLRTQRREKEAQLNFGKKKGDQKTLMKTDELIDLNRAIEECIAYQIQLREQGPTLVALRRALEFGQFQTTQNQNGNQ